MATLTEHLFTVDPTQVYDFEDFVTNELGIVLVKPPTIPICKYFLKNMCKMGSSCPYKHPPKGKTVVCKHWLRGLCKKGDYCEFLHEYNLKKMPECWFYTKLGECTNPECQYLHIDPNAKTKDCPWYARGFCKHGNDCRNKHVRLVACQLYMTGFCPKGENCEFGHPKFELPPLFDVPDEMVAVPDQEPQQKGDKKRFEDVTCYNCKEKGHYANHCPKRRKTE